MPSLPFPLLTFAIGAPFLAAALVATQKSQERAKALALIAGGVSLIFTLWAVGEVVTANGSRLFEPWSLSLLGASRPWFSADGFNAVPMALFAALTLVTLSAAPRRDSEPAMIAGTLIILGSTLTAYAAENLLLLLAGWAVSALPFIFGRLSRGDAGAEARTPVLTKAGLIAGIASLAIGLGIVGIAGSRNGLAAPWSMTDLRGSGSLGGITAFAFLMLAILLRKGIFPAHSWVISSLDHGPLLPAGLLMNAHLGAFLAGRIAIPLLPQVAHDVFPLLSDLALLTAAYTAIVAIAEREPRRLIALLAISQASSILAGIESMTAEGTTGALVLWLVVVTSTTGLIVIYRAIEVRVAGDIANAKFLGLAQQMPRLAVFFAICGLALVGIPGTLGFFAEDLLLHGTLESHPQIGLLLPLATALNAIHIFRLFSKLFLGSKGSKAPLPDALPRERWVLAACILFLVLGGLMPRSFVELRSSAAEAMAATEAAASTRVSTAERWFESR